MIASLLMLAAVNGICKTKFVWNAPPDFSSTLAKYVFLFRICAKLPIKMETALPATRAMILKMGNASYLSLITQSLKIPDVLPGIGTIKFA